MGDGSIVPARPSEVGSPRFTLPWRNDMAQRFLVGGLVLLALAAVARSDDKAASKAPTAPPHPGLERMKKLAGTWVAADKDGKPTDQVVSVYKVTAAGSAVHETLFPGQAHEMISIYHRDGTDLVMTHYCALGNQPRMKADRSRRSTRSASSSRAAPTWTRPRTSTCTRGRSPSSMTTTSSSPAPAGRAARPSRGSPAR